MFCPKCGTADQTENSYCRNCGEFLPDLTKKANLAFGGNTPEEQIRINLFLNLLSAIVSIILTISLYWTFGFKSSDVLPIIYIVAAFLLAMSGWQFSTFIIGLKLKKKGLGKFRAIKITFVSDKQHIFVNQNRHRGNSLVCRFSSLNLGKFFIKLSFLI